MLPIHPLADPTSFRYAMRQWVAGVTVVTSVFQGVRHGMTVSSFTSISLVPPMILVSLERGTRTHGLISRSGIFAVTILDVSQERLSERFAGRLGDDEDRMAGVEVETLLSGAPLLRGGIAYFDCRVVASQEAGGSTVFFAEVLAAKGFAGGDPLLYYDRTYSSLQK
jgi:flavin reductase (DIM6/NTAB) family NADH-FMN oxidoreductase RutF